MATRRDRLQSYQFLLQRVVSALVIHETDPQVSPFKRFAGSAFAGLMIAVIAVGGVAVFGMLKSGGKTSWRNPQAIVLEKETGVRYVYRNDVLYPVANQVSAMLLGATQPVSVSRNSLSGTPRGETLGIPGAPDVVPRTTDLLTSPWSLCVRPGANDQGAQTVLLVGSAPSADKPLGTGAMLARATDGEDGALHLIWNDRRFQIRDADVVLRALTWEGYDPVPVRAAWLNGLPAGTPISRFSLPDETSSFRDVRVGRLFFVRNTAGNTQFYVAMPDGLAKVTSMQADIMRGDPALNPDGVQPEEIQAGQLVESEAAFTAEGDVQPPAATPKLVTPAAADAPLCAVFPAGGGAPSVRSDATIPAGSAAGDTAGVADPGTALADRVIVPAGRGALVLSAGSPDANTGTLLLVTEPGRAFPVTPDVAEKLGYGPGSAVKMLSSVVGRLPVGPALDPGGAGLPAARP
ncbi:type VII secretion protein EccB [Actinoplanes sp. GCM10030250]|uniref:type VII secretion protein EccB n=1 Tax=Actinoplanes sp. GCM10030250 TaxID=3273376 RepID=UPI0036132675